MAADTATTRTLGPIGDKIVFENEFVRVWSLALEPGQRQPWHQHLLPYLIVPLTEGQNEMTFDDGRVRETREKPGEVIWREAGIPHELLNCSTWQYRNVLIEIKARAQRETAAQLVPFILEEPTACRRSRSRRRRSASRPGIFPTRP